MSFNYLFLKPYNFLSLFTKWFSNYFSIAWRCNPFGLRMDDFDQLRRICLLSDLWQSLQRYLLCRDSCWLRFLVALKQVPVSVLRFPWTIQSISTWNIPWLTGLIFCGATNPALSASVVICIKSRCDATDKR